VIKGALNVRQRRSGRTVATRTARSSSRPRIIIPLPADARGGSENRLRERLAAKVQLRYSQGKGAVEIAFFSDEELERILQIIGVGLE
jgi:hypothetical protein